MASKELGFCIFAMMSFFGLAIRHNTLLGDSDSVEDGMGSYILRKCCPPNQFYSTLSQSCREGGDFSIFQESIEEFLVRERIVKLSFVTGRLTECMDTAHCPETFSISNNHTNTLLSNGFIYEHYFGLFYDLDRYCLEMVGSDANSAVTLAMALCLHGTSGISKCCPEHKYFDSVLGKCLNYTKELQSGFFGAGPSLGGSRILNYRFDLQCLNSFPERFNLLSEAYLDECNNVCLRSPKKCYSTRKYCVDNVLSEAMEPSVYVCADGVTKKCCLNEKEDINCSCSN